MKKFPRMLLLASITLAATTVLTAALPNVEAANPAQPRVKHRFIAGLFRKGQAALIAEDGRIQWEIPARNVQDVWLLPGGNLLLSHGRGAKEFDLT